MALRGPTPEVRAEIDDLVADYFWALDSNDLPRFTEAFWDDAVLEESKPDGTTLTVTGATVIGEYTRDHFFGHGGYQHREQNRLYLPDPDGRNDRWILRSYWFTSCRRENGDVQLLYTGHSKSVVECRDGHWRFVFRWLEHWPASLVHPRAEGIERTEAAD